jgi:glucose-6-phosphate 1-dehydrogenase
VEAAWRFIQNILDSWAVFGSEPFFYPAGSSGPTEAAVMIARDGRAWRNL